MLVTETAYLLKDSPFGSHGKLATMMRSAVKCAAAVRVPALPLSAQPQVSTQNSILHPFASGLDKQYSNTTKCHSLCSMLIQVPVWIVLPTPVRSLSL